MPAAILRHPSAAAEVDVEALQRQVDRLARARADLVDACNEVFFDHNVSREDGACLLGSLHLEALKLEHGSDRAAWARVAADLRALAARAEHLGLGAF